MSMLKVPVAADDHVQGVEDAPVTLVEYGDYECPHCGRAYPIVKQLQEKFGDGLRFVFRNFPLSELHPHAMAAAEVAEFAGANGKFWEMHDLLFENQQHFAGPLFDDLTSRLRLSTTGMRRTLEQETYFSRIRADFKGGALSGVNGTPTFFINGNRHDDSFDFDVLAKAIHRAMSAARTNAR